MKAQVSLLLSSLTGFYADRKSDFSPPFAHHGYKKKKTKKRKLSVSSAGVERRTMDVYQEAVDYLESQQVPGTFRVETDSAALLSGGVPTSIEMFIPTCVFS